MRQWGASSRLSLTFLTSPCGSRSSRCLTPNGVRRDNISRRPRFAFSFVTYTLSRELHAAVIATGKSLTPRSTPGDSVIQSLLGWRRGPVPFPRDGERSDARACAAREQGRGTGVVWPLLHDRFRRTGHGRSSAISMTRQELFQRSVHRRIAPGVVDDLPVFGRLPGQPLARKVMEG